MRSDLRVSSLKRFHDDMVKGGDDHVVLQKPEQKRLPKSARRALQEGHKPSKSANSILSRNESNFSLNTSRSLYFSSSDEKSSNASSSLAPNAFHEPSHGGHRNHRALAMKIAFPVAAFLLLSFCLALILVRKRKAKRSNQISSLARTQRSRARDDEVLLESLAPGLPTRFTHAQMERATNGFREKLGAGGYGTVYQGISPSSGLKIAVKVFSDTSTTACRMAFCAEVMSIGEKKHRNLVQLQGFCVEDNHRMLVYELMENGSLKKVLFGEKGEGRKGMVLSWERRKAIAIDTARALAFLHEGGEQKVPVIHCDVKPENILLNENWEAKVSDFGLAKLLWSSRAHHDEAEVEEDDDGGNSSTPLPSFDFSSRLSNASGLISFRGIRGTFGYLAPEWTRSDLGPDSITTASDVYSFGVVLLELVAGRRSMVPGHPFLLGHAFDMLADGHDLAEVLDPSLLLQDASQTGGTVSSVDLEDVRNIVKIALWCLQEDLNLRPKMVGILNMLADKEPVATPPFCDYFAGSSHFFDEGHHHESTHIMFSDNTSASYDMRAKGSAFRSQGIASLQSSILSGR